MKQIKQWLKEGMTRHEAYARALDEGMDGRKVANALSQIPDVVEWQKLKVANAIFTAIYGGAGVIVLWLLVYALDAEYPGGSLTLLLGLGLTAIYVWIVWGLLNSDFRESLSVTTI